MLEAYCDESQADMLGKPLLCLAAYLAPDERWHAFSDEWRREILEPFSIPYLHAVEFRNLRTSLYRHLDVVSRRRLLGQACAIVTAHVDAGFVTYLRPDDLKALTTPVERSRWGGAYGICVELLLSMMSNHLGRPDRVNIYLEAGHANTAAALQKIANFRSDTEPVEWPEVAEGQFTNDVSREESRMRVSAMRIGTYGSVLKAASPPSQAADLFAYLTATSLRNDDDPVYSGSLDQLLTRKPHVLSPWGPAALAELVQSLRTVEREWSGDRQGFYQMRKVLHEHGFRSHALPWGVVVDKGPQDQMAAEMKAQVEAIRRKVSDPSR